MGESKNDIQIELEAQREAAISLFDKYQVEQKKANTDPPYHNDKFGWHSLPNELKIEGEQLISRLVPLGQKVAVVCRNSILVNDADLQEVPILIRTMISAIEMKSYTYKPARPIYHEGGYVIGTQPAEQEEEPISSTWHRSARGVYLDAHDSLMRILRFGDETASSQLDKPEHTEIVKRYLANSAFIMMWIDKGQPELEDVRDAVRETFDKFGIHAVRADDIEHEGKITQRILDEIRTSEFLFADLTGARPSVYYEVGYAHAFGRRVILFRKVGTGLHFDLADYNCPEYQNLHDLREQLTRRLESVTNKSLVAETD